MKHTLLFPAVLMASSLTVSAETLTVYAPDYFGSEWGPGPAIKEAFEASCDCTLEWVTGDVLPRILLEGENTSADAVIGLNTDVTKRARESGLFQQHGQDTSDLTMPIAWEDDTFLPFNWSYTAFVYDNTKITDAPTSFAALLDAPDDLRLVIQDPRSSISGLALMLWVKSVFGDEAVDAWSKLAPKIVTVTAGWSEAYGMFTDGEADMVLSFTTSPAYHIVAEDDRTKSAAIFDEGHYLMAEVAARVKTSDQPELAQAFIDFILTPEFQRIIPTGNWSYPAKLDAAELPAEFAELGQPPKALFYSEDEAAALREPALAEWTAGLKP